jgi:hypothetical protein
VPVVVVALGSTYGIAFAAARPYASDKLPLGGQGSQPARVGQTVFMDLGIPARREGAHITGVHVNNLTPGLTVRFVSTTFDRTNRNQLAGWPLSCARPASVSPVAGTPLRSTTYLRTELTATRPGRLGFTSITVDWADGPLHGSATGPFQYALRATNGTDLPCPRSQSVGSR